MSKSPKPESTFERHALTAQSKRRAEMIGIVDWRMAQCAARDVGFRFDTWAEADDVTALDPEAVIVATGRLPHKDILSSGNDLTVSSWDILSGDAKPGGDVLIYDEAGDHAALRAAEVLAASGAKLEIMTRDRSFSPDVMAMNLVPYMRSLQEKDVTFTVTWLLKGARKAGNRLMATLGTDYSRFTRDKHYGQIVVNYGTLPNAEPYFDLKEHSVNRGEVDHAALIDGWPQALRTNPEGRFQPCRIGDAVSARNTHAAIYDALRLMKDI